MTAREALHLGFGNQKLLMRMPTVVGAASSGFGKTLLPAEVLLPQAAQLGLSCQNPAATNRTGNSKGDENAVVLQVNTLTVHSIKFGESSI